MIEDLEVSETGKNYITHLEGDTKKVFIVGDDYAIPHVAVQYMGWAGKECVFVLEKELESLAIKWKAGEPSQTGLAGPMTFAQLSSFENSIGQIKFEISGEHLIAVDQDGHTTAFYFDEHYSGQISTAFGKAENAGAKKMKEETEVSTVVFQSKNGLVYFMNGEHNGIESAAYPFLGAKFAAAGYFEKRFREEFFADSSEKASEFTIEQACAKDQLEKQRVGSKWSQEVFDLEIASLEARYQEVTKGIRKVVGIALSKAPSPEVAGGDLSANGQKLRAEKA